MSQWPALSIAQAHTRLTAPGSPYEIEHALIHGIPLRVWKNVPATNRDVVAAARTHAERPFLIHESDRITFAAFHRAVCTLARELIEQGLRKGDRVALAMRNLPEWPVVFYAASVAGGIVTPLNAWWTGAELQYALKDCGARFAVLDSERADRLSEHLHACDALEHVYVGGTEKTGAPLRNVHLLAEVIGPPARWASLADVGMPDVNLEPDDAAAIFYTSGTSGRPKGAVATHRNMLCNIVGAACAATRTALRQGQAGTVDDTAVQPSALVTVPFFHVTGCCAILSPALHGGHKLVLLRRWDAEEAMRCIQREQIAALVCVPAVAWQLVEHPALRNYDLSSLVSIGYGGAAAAPELRRRISETLPAAVPGHGWGMTETCGLTMTHSGEDYAERPTSCGAPLPVIDLQIKSVDGAQVLAVGEIGELWVRGPNVVRGYWQRASETAETFVDGWLRTGDLARLDPEGFCYVVDRIKDVVIRGGENIYCVEVENALYEHPGVLDAAVIGRSHRTLGEEPVGVVHIAAGHCVTEAQLRAHLGRRLAAFKIPVQIVFWPTMLPRNANGKILKRELKSALP
jgi:long-chain acyl-CoA synthetase